MAQIVRVYLPDLDYSFKTLEITSNTTAEDVMSEVIQKLVTNETILPVDPSKFCLYYLLGEQKKEIKKGERMLSYVKKWGKKDDCKLIMKAVVDNIKLYNTALYEVNKRKEDSSPVTPTSPPLISQDTHTTSNLVTTSINTNTSTPINTNNVNSNNSNTNNNNNNNNNNIDDIDNSNSNNSLSKSLNANTNTNTNSTTPTIIALKQQLTHSDPTPTHTPSNTNTNTNNNITIASPILIDDEELVQLETLDLPPPILRISKPERGSMSTSQVSEQKARNILNDLERAYNSHSLSTAQDLLNFLTTQGI